MALEGSPGIQEISIIPIKTDQEKPKVSLERNNPYKCNIPYRKDHFYRAVDQKAYEDFIKNGEMVGSKHDFAYFQKGFANERYVAHGRIKPIIIETDDRAGFETDERTGYAKVTTIKKSDVENGKIPLRIWQHQGNNNWVPIYDSTKNIE